MSSYFQPQYLRIKAQHGKVKESRAHVISLIRSIHTSKSIEEFESIRNDLDEALLQFQLNVDTYSRNVGSLRRKVENMSINTPEQADLKEAELKLFEELKDGDDDGLEYDNVSLSQDIVPSTRLLVDQTIASVEARMRQSNSILSVTTPSSGSQLDPVQSNPTHVESFTNVLNQVVSMLKKPQHPTVVLTPFDGESTHWDSFYSQYTHIIDSDSDLSNHAKLIHLRSVVTGKTYETIRGIPVRDDTLQITIDRLKHVYGRSKRSNTTLINQLLNIHPKSMSLEHQLDCTVELMNKVHEFNDKSIVNNFMLIHQIANSIHPKFIEMMYKEEPQTMMEALELIETDLRETIEVQHLKSTFSAMSHSNKQVEQSTVTIPKQLNQPLCVYCGKHSFSDCKVITSVAEKKSILKSKKLCFKCLTPFESFHQCDRTCQLCSKPHHRSICDTPSSSLKPNQSSITATVTSSDTSYSMPRLYTATTHIQNPVNCRTTPVQVLLDHGSMVSLISRSLTEELNIKPHSTVPMTIRGCGGIPTGGTTHDVVTVNLITTNGILPINALVLDTPITHPMKHDPLSEEDLSIVKSTCDGDYPHLAQHSTFSPDLLISIGSTQTILNGSTISNLPSGYKLVKSILGPIIIGEPDSNKQPNHNSIHNPVVMTGVIAESTDQSTWIKLKSSSSFHPVFKPSQEPSLQLESPVQLLPSIITNSGIFSDNSKHTPIAIHTESASFNFDIDSFEYSILTDKPIPITGTTPRKKSSTSIPRLTSTVSTSNSSPC